MKKGSKEERATTLGGTKYEMIRWLSQLGLDSKYIGIDRILDFFL